MISTAQISTQSPELSESEFRLLSRVIYAESGINLGDQKIPLVRARLIKRLRVLGLTSFRKYYEFVTKEDTSGVEMVNMLNAISTNLTHFFREPQHFEYLKSTFFKKWANEQQIRILCAGCSTGEEPYSIAITAREHFGEAAVQKVGIVAGDICTKVLAHAKAGLYRTTQVRPAVGQRMYSSFLQGTGDCQGLVAIAPEVKSLVTFKYLNLMKPIETSAPFHAVFCRNVAIYFDHATQQTVFRRLSQALVDGGTLFLGHSESMASNNCGFKYVQPATYEHRK